MEPSVIELLEKWQTGDQAALGALVELLYDELRLIAASKLRIERRQHTIRTTALVDEVYAEAAGRL